jgi:hypothetical protein
MFLFLDHYVLLEFLQAMIKFVCKRAGKERKKGKRRGGREA